ncbi:MAG: 2OG-Fe(II) oxygenase [Planctomycetota bacterium]
MIKQVPWQHLIYDGFLLDDVLTEVRAEIGSERYDYEFEARGTGRIEYSLAKSETLWRAIYSRRTLALLSAAFGVKVSLNKHNLVQLRRMNDLTPDFPLHNDSTPDGETIVSFLYLSPGWSPACGGYLHLFGSENDPSPTASVEPIENRLVAFRTAPLHWHSVARVHNWERISVLALWDIGEAIASSSVDQNVSHADKI